MKTRILSALLLASALALLASACADDGQDAATTTTVHDMEAMDDADMADMNMGDPTATPATEIDGAEIRTADFVLLDTRPEGYDDVVGEAAIARYDAGTTVTVEVSSLMPGESYIAHLHDDVCSENGGAHYKFDPEGSDVPPNEIHLAFVADENGFGFMTAENAQVAGPEGVAVVVHPVDLIDNKIACAEFDA
jgi:hypothetical protein